MTNRREFLQAATLLSAAPLLAGRATYAATRGSRTFAAVVFDTRHPQARDFAAHAGARGVPVRAIEADITDLWQDDLRRRWQAGSAPVAGLTERPALFLLERLAWEHDLRVVFAAEHTLNSHDTTVHSCVRTADAGLAHTLTAAGRDWPRVLADKLMENTSLITHDYRPTDAGLAAGLDEPVKLYSWIIAPRRAV